MSHIQHEPDLTDQTTSIVFPSVYQGLIDDTKVSVKKIKQQLADIDRGNAESRQKEGKGEGTADERTRTNMTMGKHTFHLIE